MGEKSRKIPRMLVMPFTEMGNIKSKKTFKAGKNNSSRFLFFNVVIKIPIRYPNTDVE